MVHYVTVPFHFAPEVMIHDLDGNSATLTTPSSNFRIQWSSSADWHAEVQRHFVAPSYGTKVETTRLLLSCKLASGSLNTVITPD